MENKRVEIYVVYLDGKPLLSYHHRRLSYSEPSGAKATITVLAKRFCEYKYDGYYGSSQENKERLIEIERTRFEIRIFIDSDEVIC